MTDDPSRILRIITTRLVNEAITNSKSIVSTESSEFKKLKRGVRENEHLIPEYVDYLFTSLKRSDSERRKALMSLFDYFFNRSHNFRQKTVDKLQLLLLVCEIDPLHHPLPGPSTEAKELKVYAIKTIKKWHEKFGPAYYKLDCVSDFLRESKAVDFDSASAELLAERKRKEIEERKNAEISQKVADNVRRKFGEAKGDIERCIASVDTALSILIPVFCTDTDADTAENSHFIRKQGDQIEELQAAHGYANGDTISIVLDSLIPEVAISEDNEALLESIRDAKVMLEVYRKKILSWQRKINGAIGVELLTRELTTLKRKIDQRCEKIAEMKLKPKKRSRKGAESSESEESDLEEVPEKQLEDFVPPDEVPRHIMERVEQMERAENADQPSCSKSLEITSSASEQKVEPKPRIPIVSFGLDLKYWGERRSEAPIPRNNADCHRFWRPPDDDDRPAINEKASVEEVRVITWIGEPQRAERRCKARLPNGKLCPRMDLRKCPLHGLIIDRDDEGFPLKEVNTKEVCAAISEQEHREEEEYLRRVGISIEYGKPHYSFNVDEKLRGCLITDMSLKGGRCLDLEAGTGRSFVVKPKKAKVKVESVRERLEKKLLNPRTLKRVSAVLDSARKARLQRKFGDQFAHALSK